MKPLVFLALVGGFVAAYNDGHTVSAILCGLGAITFGLYWITPDPD